MDIFVVNNRNLAVISYTNGLVGKQNGGWGLMC